jgi:hypothetical protein
VVLFEAISGRPAFGDAAEDEYSDGTTDSQLDEDPQLDDYPQLEGRAPSVRSLRRLPASLASAVDACLEPDPAHRPSVAELAAALETVPGAGSPRAVRTSA